PAHGGLDGHVEHLPRNQFLHLLDQLPSAERRVVTVNDQRQGIDLVVIDQHIEAHQLGGLETVGGVIEGCIAAADRFQAVEEVQYHLVHRQVVDDLDLSAEEDHVLLYAALFDTQGNNAAQMVLRHENIGPHDGFTHFVDQRGIGQAGRVVDIDHLAVLLQYLEHHGGRGGDQVQIVLAL